MAHKGTIVVVTKGQDLPDTFLEAALKANPGPHGFAAVPEKGTIDWEGDQVIDSLDKWKQRLEHYKAHDRILFLGNYDAGYDEEDAQPVVLQADHNDQADMLGFIAGDFSGFAQAGSSRSDAHFATINILEPRIQQLYEMADAKVDKVMHGLSNKLTKDEFLNTITGEGTIVILGSTGEIHTFSKTTLPQFSWGYTTDPHGYKEGGFPAKEEEPEKAPITRGKGSMAGKFTLKKESKPTEEKKEEVKPTTTTTQVGDTTVIHKQEKPTVPKTDTVLQETPVIVPKKIGNSQLRAWFNQTMGFLPENWKKMRGQTIKVPNKPAEKTVLEDVSANKQDETAIAAALKKADERRANKDVEPHHKPDAAPSVPVIPTTQIKAFTDTFMKSAEMQEVMKQAQPTTVDQVKAGEKKVPNWTEQTGIHLEDTANWPYSAFLALVKDYPQTAAAYCVNCRNELMKFILATESKKDQKTEEVSDFKKKYAIKK